MRIADGSRHPRSFVIVCLALTALASLSLAASAHSSPTSVNVVNNSSREIRNIYVSHVNADDWSNDLLGESTISANQSATVNGFLCDQEQVKVIAEDQDGCFLSTVVACGSTSSWTISNDTARDCGY